MSSKLFEEAVADAKKLREVAEENAKKAILEAVTPRIREFIESQLIEGEEDDKDEGADKEDTSKVAEDEEVTLNEDALMSLIEMLGGSEILDSLTEGKGYISESIDKALNRLPNKERNKILQLADKINENADNLETKRIVNNVAFNQENKTMTTREKFYEVDLQALREAIEDETSEMEYEGMHSPEDSMDEMYEDDMEMEGMYEDEDMDEMEMDEMDVEDLMNEIRLVLDLGDDIDIDALPEMLRGMAEEDDEDDEAEEGDVELADEDLEGEGAMPDLEGMFGDDEPAEEMNETFEIDPRMLKQELYRMRRMISEGNVEDQFGGKGEGNAGVDGAYGGKGKKNVGAKGAFGGGKEGQDVFTNPPQMNKLNEAIRKLRRQNRAQSEKLNKYRGAVNTLREQLEDLNLFNAKLLYVNKLLQNKSLSESQKRSVIKALDEAKSLGETKALYKSLTESLGTSRKASLNESVRYGSSSRTTTSASTKRADGASDLGRWQKLAGLK